MWMIRFMSLLVVRKSMLRLKLGWLIIACGCAHESALIL